MRTLSAFLRKTASNVTIFKLAMKVRLLYDRKEKVVEVEKGARVKDVLEKAGVNLETVIVKRGKEIVTEEEEVSSGDVIEAIRVISGG